LLLIPGENYKGMVDLNEKLLDLNENAPHLNENRRDLNENPPN
jgi:hypothetical protein